MNRCAVCGVEIPADDSHCSDCAELADFDTDDELKCLSLNSKLEDRICEAVNL